MATTGFGLLALLVLRVTWLLARWIPVRYAERAQTSRQTHVASIVAALPQGAEIIYSCGDESIEIGATPSIGTFADSYDNVLAEIVNGYYKAELIRGPACFMPWKSVEDVEPATLGWVHWHNTQHRHG